MSAAATRALMRIVTLCRTNKNIGAREIRFFEIALEGLGMVPGQRRAEIEAAIQRKREHFAAKHAARQGGCDAHP